VWLRDTVGRNREHRDNEREAEAAEDATRPNVQYQSVHYYLMGM
jgi:hypothetical protein